MSIKLYFSSIIISGCIAISGKRGIANNGGKGTSFNHCSRIPDCTLDASCLSCHFPEDCVMGDLISINCTPLKECGANQISIRKTALCRYCWQTWTSEHSCSPQTNCSTTASGLVATECTVHPSTICKGHRTFNKRIKCNWSSGISWSKTMLLSITLGKTSFLKNKTKTKAYKSGGFGADRFYLGLWKSAIGKLFSFGGLGIWTIVDVVLVATGYIRPSDGSMFM